ncbi:MAG: tetratricopeptide repeat protein [Blastomonas sp.]
MIAVLLAALMAFSVPLAAGDRAAGRAAMAKADAFRAAGNYRAARIEMMNAIQADPDWPQARIRQAEIFLKLFDAVGAEAELRRALDLGAKPDAIRHLMADALLQQGDTLRARKWLTEGPVAGDQAGYAMRLLGRIELADGNLDAARSAFDRALAYAPDDSMLWVDIARFRFLAGDQGGAVQAVDHAVALDNANIRALQFRGELMRSQYGLVSALPWFERALAIDPNDVPVLEEYGATLGDMGRMKAMLDVARRIIALQPRNPRAYFMQAVLAARAGKFDLARDLVQKTGDAMERVPAMMQLEGVIEFQLGNNVRAIDRFDRLVTQQPHNIQARNLLARALYAEGKYRDLLDRFAADASRDGAGAYLQTLVGRSLEAIGEREAAANFLDKTLEQDPALLTTLDERQDLMLLATAASRDPGSAKAVIPFVRQLVANGNFARALGEAQRLADANPGAPDAQILLGDVHLAAGNSVAALLAYDRAAAIRLSEPLMVRMVTALRGQGRGGESEQLLLRFAGFTPGNVTASRLLANAYIDHGNWPAASSLLTELRARLGDNNPGLLSDLAMAQLRTGNAMKARKTAYRAYHSQPASPLATHVFGLAVSEAGGRKLAAVQLLEKAQDMRPGNPWLAYHLARAYAAAGEKREAIAALGQALNGGPFPERDAAMAMLQKLRAG